MLSRLATASAPKKNARGNDQQAAPALRVTGDEHVARDGLGVSVLDVFVDTVHQQQHDRLAQGRIERQDDRCDGNAQGQGRRSVRAGLHGKRHAKDGTGNRIGRVIRTDRDGTDHGKLHRGAHNGAGHHIAHDKADQRSEHNGALKVNSYRSATRNSPKGQSGKSGSS